MVIIGISGGSGAGKSFLANKISERFPGRVSILAFDNYFKDHSRLPMEERALINYDSPDAYDSDLFYEQIISLMDKKPINVPIYDFATHTRKQETTKLVKNDIIIIEGIMIYSIDSILPILDYSIYVDCQADRRLARRIKRDIQERGRNLDSVLTQYFKTVRPMHYKYVEPKKSIVDYIYDNDIDDGLNQKAFNEIIQKIASLIE